MAMWLLRDGVVNASPVRVWLSRCRRIQPSGRTRANRVAEWAEAAVRPRPAKLRPTDLTHPTHGGEHARRAAVAGATGWASCVSTTRRRGRAAGRSARVSLPHGPGWLRCNSGVGALLGVGRCADFRSSARVSETGWADSHRVAGRGVRTRAARRLTLPVTR